MLEKKFIVAEKSINKKAIAIILFATFVFLIGRLNDKYKIWEFDKNLFALLCTLFITAPLLYILIAARNYRNTGFLFLNSVEIRVRIKSLNANFLIKDLDYLTLYYKGIYGEDYAGYAGGIAGAYSKDGSGNFLEFSHMQKKYRINIVFEGREDLNALNFLFKEIENNSDLVPKVVYPFEFI